MPKGVGYGKKKKGKKGASKSSLMDELFKSPASEAKKNRGSSASSKRKASAISDYFSGRKK